MWLIIGANGFLGTYLIRNILKASQEVVYAVSRSIPPKPEGGGVKWLRADITKDPDIAALREISEESGRNKVIYLAAYHNPDLVQKNPRYAWETNITALSRVLNTLENVDCFFYSSTDSVYGESENGYHYKETDSCSPQNRYGVQKKTAEALVLGYGYNIVRFPFLIGRSVVKHKKHFFDEILDSLSQNKPFEMFADSYRSALDFDTASRLLIDIMQNHMDECPPVINISGDEDLSKYDIGCMLARQYGFPEELIVPISVRADKEIFRTPRAVSTLMDNTVLKQLIQTKEVKISFS